MNVNQSQSYDKVQVWNGVSYAVVTREKAEELAEAGTHQICDNLQAKDLLTAAEIKKRAKAAKAEKEPEAKKQLKPKPAKGSYSTKEQKSEESKLFDYAKE